MNTVNYTFLVGNVGNITELQEMSNGKKVINITMATQRSYHDSENNKKFQTLWHNIVLWNGLAEVGSKRVYKGCLLLVIGEINYREKDKNITAEIVAQEIRVLSKKEYSKIESLKESLLDKNTTENLKDKSN